MLKMFEGIDPADLVLVYQGLKKLIEVNSGNGFVNCDQGHPFYRMGATGKPGDLNQDPERNTLYRMLRELSGILSPSCGDLTWWYDFSEWKDFCQFAIDAYDRDRGYTE